MCGLKLVDYNVECDFLVCFVFVIDSCEKLDSWLWYVYEKFSKYNYFFEDVFLVEKCFRNILNFWIFMK